MRNVSVPTTILVAQMATVAIVVGLTATVMLIDVRTHNVDMARDRSMSVTRIVADTPSVIDAVQSNNPSRDLQPYSTRIADDAGMDFVTIFSVDGIRFTHTDRSAIGEKMVRGYSRALHGATFTEEFDGSRGESVRAVSPILDESGKVVALVTAGDTVRNIYAEFDGRMGWILLLAVLVFAIGAVISWVVSRIVRRSTGDFGARDLNRMFSYYESVLRSVREGLLLIEPELGIVLRNDEATRLLELPPDDGRPLPLGAVKLPDSLRDVLVSRRRAVDEIHLTGTRVIVVNQQSATDRPGLPPAPPGWRGTVVTLRDHTELQSLAGELDSVRNFADSLRSQAHEFANRMHTMVSLIELGRSDEAIEFATEELSTPQALTDNMLRAVGEPVVTAVLLAKTALATERGIELDLQLQDVDRDRLPSARELVTILGNLLDNAFDAVADQQKPRLVRLTIGTNSDGLYVRVDDSGPGIRPGGEADVFARGWSTKQPADNGTRSRGLGLALVDQAVRRLGGRIEVGRAARGLGGAGFVVSIPDDGYVSGTGRGADTEAASPAFETGATAGGGNG